MSYIMGSANGVEWPCIIKCDNCKKEISISGINYAKCHLKNINSFEKYWTKDGNNHYCRKCSKRH